MALNFPSSPTIGQVYTDTISGFSYEWDGTVWRSFSPSSSSQIKALDDISGSFDGIETTFPLTSNASQITSPSPQSLIINLGGVIQDPTGDYTVLGSNLIFSTPPTSGLSFSGVSLGPAVPINTITDGTVTDGSLRISTNAVVGSATTFTEDLVVEGDARVTGILTVGTSSLTLNGNTNTINGVTISSGIVTATDVTVGLTTITGSTGNIITPGSVTTGNLQSSSINNGPLAGFRNAIINGAMQVWQRGTIQTVSGAYGADRFWMANAASASRSTDVPAGFTYSTKLTYSGVVMSIGQPIELPATGNSAPMVAGETVTLSFYAKVDSGTENFSVSINFRDSKFSGTNQASFSAIGGSGLTATTSWQRFEKTFTVPTVNGTNNIAGLEIGNIDRDFYITGVQLEAGPVATPFERRPIGTELALCQRYFEIFSANNRYYATVGTEVSNVPLFWTPKRATPTLAQFAAGSASNLSSTSFAASDSVSGRMENVTTGTGDSLVHNVKISASAEL